jgi:hypothetical protein
MPYFSRKTASTNASRTAERDIAGGSSLVCVWRRQRRDASGLEMTWPLGAGRPG